MTTPTFYAHTMPGIEEIAWLEIRERLPQARFVDKLFAKEQNGIVLFQYDGSLQSLLQLRTTEDVFLVALTLDKVTRGWKDLYRLTNLIAQKIVFREAVDRVMQFQRDMARSGPPTFRVISRLYGRHEYRRKDLEKSVVKGVKARYPHWKLAKDNARLEIWVNMLGSRLICGLRLTDRTMRHRFKKVKELKASLRPSVAAAMIHLTEPQADDVFLDPMSGSGTLLMERRMSGPYRQLLGGDIDQSRARYSYLNVLKMRKERPSSFSVHHLDGMYLPFAAGSIDKVAANLPFGKQIGSANQIARLYPAFFAEVARVLKGNGRAAILSSEYDVLKDAIRQQPRLTILTGYSISTLGQWGRIYIIRRELD